MRRRDLLHVKYHARATVSCASLALCQRPYLCSMDISELPGEMMQSIQSMHQERFMSRRPGLKVYQVCTLLRKGGRLKGSSTQGQVAGLHTFLFVLLSAISGKQAQPMRNIDLPHTRAAPASTPADMSTPGCRPRPRTNEWKASMAIFACTSSTPGMNLFSCACTSRTMA